MGIGNELNSLGCFTSRCPICTENTHVQQQIHNFIEAHVALEACLAQLVCMYFLTKLVGRSTGLKLKNKSVFSWVKHQPLPVDVLGCM